MGLKYTIKCTKCTYRLSVIQGIGMRYSPNSVFEATWDYSSASDLDEPIRGKPLLEDLVKNAAISTQALALLAEGAVPQDDYGHELYACPTCHHLANHFHFRLKTKDGDYEPNYACSFCHALLACSEIEEITRGLKIVYKSDSNALWQCPKCGNDKLKYGNNFSNWD